MVLLLQHGLAPEQPDEAETPLMTAAARGNLDIVTQLVAAGADVDRHAHDNVEWTASFYARSAGHADVADWLQARMRPELREAHQQTMAARPPMFRPLYEHGHEW